jgi:exopolysaccharide biosynthesis polyprenyl glycosylphosphotransferase
MNGHAATLAPQGEIRDWLSPPLALPRADFSRLDFLLTLAVLGDLLLIVSGLLLGYWVRFESGWITVGNEPGNLMFGEYVGMIWVSAFLLVLTFGYLQLYTPQRLARYGEPAQIIFKGASFWLFALFSLNMVTRVQPQISRLYIVIAYATCLASVLFWRWGFCRLLKHPALAHRFRQRILFVGWTGEAHRIRTLIEEDPSHPYEVVGWVPAPLSRREVETPPNLRALGDCSRLAEVLARERVDVVVLADLGVCYEEIVGLANLCEQELVQFKIIPSYFQILLSGLKLEPISGVPVLGVSELPLDRLVNRFLKRCVDIAGGLVGLLLALPITAVCGLLVYLESPGPIFYTQIRSGRNGRPFRLYKLRSMRLDAEAESGAQWAERDDPRCLRIGRFLRRWKLDEFPQFWNVLKGDMSLVGPRPERPELISRFKHQVPHYNARLTCKPGLTGWAQVNGAVCNTDLEQRIRYDIYYLENWCLWFDLQMLFQTLFVPRYNVY